MLNKIRNGIAHDQNFEVSKEQASKLSSELHDLNLFYKDKSAFMALEITCIVGYLESVAAGQQKPRFRSYSSHDIKKIINFIKEMEKSKSLGRVEKRGAVNSEKRK